MKTVLPYRKAHLNTRLWLGIGVAVFAVPYFFMDTLKYWLNGGFYISFSLYNLASYWLKRKNGYLILEDDKITITTWRKRTINLSDIRSIVKYSKGYVLHTAGGKIGIDTLLLDTDNRHKLMEYMSGLAVRKGFNIPGLPVTA